MSTPSMKYETSLQGRLEGGEFLRASSVQDVMLSWRDKTWKSSAELLSQRGVLFDFNSLSVYIYVFPYDLQFE